MFGEDGVGVVDGAVLCVDVEFITQRGAAGGHAHRGFGGHAAVGGHALLAMAGCPAGEETMTGDQKHQQHRHSSSSVYIVPGRDT